MRGECCSALYSEWSIKTKLLCTAEVITQLVLAQLILILGLLVRRRGLSSVLSSKKCMSSIPFLPSHPWKVVIGGDTALLWLFSPAGYFLWGG